MELKHGMLFRKKQGQIIQRTVSKKEGEPKMTRLVMYWNLKLYV